MTEHHVDPITMTAAKGTAAMVVTEQIARQIRELIALDFYDEHRTFLEQQRQVFEAFFQQAAQVVATATRCRCPEQHRN